MGVKRYDLARVCCGVREGRRVGSGGTVGATLEAVWARSEDGTHEPYVDGSN